jgi:hypothetical protein
MQLRVRTREADAIDTGRHLLAMIDPAVEAIIFPTTLSARRLF